MEPQPQPSSSKLSTSGRESVSAVVVAHNIGDATEQLSQNSSTLTRSDGQALRLLFAVDSRFPGLGGAESQALKLAIALREQGVDVEFVTPRVDKTQPLEETHHGFSVIRIDYPQIRWLGSLIVMFRFGRYLIANAGRFDAVHIHITHLMAAAAGFARARSKLPVITKISGFYEFEGGVLDPTTRFKPLNYLIRLGLKKVDFVQTISVQTREKLLDAGFSEKQIQFVPNGIDTRNPPEHPAQNDTLRIGYCGRLRDVKGVHVLLDGFAVLKGIYPDKHLQLVIAGSGETQAALQTQARDLGIDLDVDWLGTIEDTMSFYASIDFYVQPSFAEGLPNAVMEAMVTQRPVVATNIGGNNDLIDHDVSGLLFEVGDAQGLAQQLARFIEAPELARALATAGRALMEERYGFESVTRQLVELYREQ